MVFSKVPFSLLCILGLALMAHVVQAQDSATDFLNAHNAARSKVGVPPLAWNESVAAFAKNYADQRKGDCQLIHSGPSYGYGENLAGNTADRSGVNAVMSWVGEKANYDYNSNSCVGGECRHYTQVVWKNSTSLGCAKVRCNNGGTFIGCNYYPPGNWPGQRPY
ncbi:Ves allergen [Sesbania bispinosa]|nr:Ves allergen [Sesbania bispinosa]